MALRAFNFVFWGFLLTHFIQLLGGKFLGLRDCLDYTPEIKDFICINHFILATSFGRVGMIVVIIPIFFQMRKTYGQKYYYNIVSNWQSWASYMWSRIYYTTTLFIIIKVSMSLLRMFIFNKLGIRFSSHYHVKCHKIKDGKEWNAMTKTNPLSKWQNTEQPAKRQENPGANNVCR